MRIAILLTTTRNFHHLPGLVEAALGRGHTLSVFAMDKAVHILEDPKLRALLSRQGVEFSFCSLNASAEGIDSSIVSDPHAGAGSQYNNALMMRDADRVINL